METEKYEAIELNILAVQSFYPRENQTYQRNYLKPDLKLPIADFHVV